MLIHLPLIYVQRKNWTKNRLITVSKLIKLYFSNRNDFSVGFYGMRISPWGVFSGAVGTALKGILVSPL